MKKIKRRIILIAEERWGLGLGIRVRIEKEKIKKTEKRRIIL